jgi:hypothetical protein
MSIKFVSAARCPREGHKNELNVPLLIKKKRRIKLSEHVMNICGKAKEKGKAVPVTDHEGP